MSYPIAISFNQFSITILLILFGLTGRLDIAAEIGLVQGAVTMLFMALSANGRNLVLAGGGVEHCRRVIAFRVLAVIPIWIIVWLLTVSLFDVSAAITVAVLGRRSAEWLADMHLAEREFVGDSTFAQFYIVLQALALAQILFSVLTEADGVMDIALQFWALSPLLISIVFLAKALKLGVKSHDGSAISLGPHLGSTIVIGTSAYLLRLMLFIMAGKFMAGALYSGFAIGGMLVSFYVYALGPTLILRKGVVADVGRTLLEWFAGLLCAAGVTIWFYLLLVSGLDAGDHYLLSAVAYSLVGGGIMLKVQYLRLLLIPQHGRKVFIADASANALLLLAVAAAFLLAGLQLLVATYLFSAFTNLLAYRLVTPADVWSERTLGARFDPDPATGELHE